MSDNSKDTTKPERTGPEPGTWAYTARLMAQLEPDFDWDTWKDEMKEQELFGRDE